MIEVVFFLMTVIALSSLVLPKIIFQAKATDLSNATNYLAQNTVTAINDFKAKGSKYDGTTDSITSANVLPYTPPNFENDGKVDNYWTFDVTNKKALTFGFQTQAVNKFDFKLDYSKYCSDESECGRLGRILALKITRYCLNGDFSVDTANADTGTIIVKNCQI
jgi:hypothetical protein